MAEAAATISTTSSSASARCRRATRSSAATSSRRARTTILARPRLRRRAGRRRRRHALGRLEDARRARADPARARPTLLLLDEPTNYLDLESILWLESFLRDYPGTVVMTCHDRDVMNRVVKKIVEIDGGAGAQLHRRLRLLRAGARARGRAPRGRSTSASRRCSRRRGASSSASRAHAAKAAQVQSRIKKLDKIEKRRAAAPHRREEVRVPRAAALGRRRRQGRRASRKAYGARVVHDGLDAARAPQRALGGDGRERRRQVDAAQDDGRRARARRRRGRRSARR